MQHGKVKDMANKYKISKKHLRMLFTDRGYSPILSPDFLTISNILYDAASELIEVLPVNKTTREVISLLYDAQILAHENIINKLNREEGNP